MATADAKPVPCNFRKWIDEVRPLLQPPVGNKLLYGAGQHKVMVVGGPNQRRDYHIEAGEEVFYQIEGDMCVEIYEHGHARPVPIKQGEIFLLPGNIPHSPQRKAGTVGLVLERERLPEEIDGLRWYTKDGSQVLYQETFHCTDLGIQLKPVIQRFFASDCATSDIPDPTYGGGKNVPFVDTARSAGNPVNLLEWVAKYTKDYTKNVIMYGAGAEEEEKRAFSYTLAFKTVGEKLWEDEWQQGASAGSRRIESSSRGATATTTIGGGGGSSNSGSSGSAEGQTGEVFLYQLEGTCEVQLRDNTTKDVEEGGGGEESGAITTFTLEKDHVFLLPGGGRYDMKCRWGQQQKDGSSSGGEETVVGAGGGNNKCLCLVFTNSSVPPRT